MAENLRTTENEESCTTYNMLKVTANQLSFFNSLWNASRVEIVQLYEKLSDIVCESMLWNS